MAEFNYNQYILDQKVKLFEMARTAAVAFKLAPDYKDKLASVKIGAAHKAMIDYLEGNDNKAATIGDISRATGKDSASINQPYFRQTLVNSIFEPVPLKATAEPNVEDENDVFVDPKDVKHGKRLANIIDPEDMVLGSDIEDELESDVLSFGPDTSDEEEPPASDIEKTEPVKLTGPKYKAAEFTNDNSRLIQSIINNYALAKTKGAKLKEAFEPGSMSSKDIASANVKSKAAAEAKLPELIKKLIDKIKNEDPEVQDEILKSLEYSFKSVNYMGAYNRIAKELGKAPTVVPKAKEEEPEDDDEENIDEAIDKLMMERFKRYAGLKK